MKKILVVVFVMMFASAVNAQDAKLKLSEGTMSIAGSGGFAPGFDIAEMTGFLTISPTVGYFVMDNLAVIVDADIIYPMGFDGAELDYGIGAGAKYYHDLGSVIAYGGALIGYADALSFSVPLGVLFPLNEHVALDFGAELNYDTDASQLTTPAGWMGVAAFF